MIDTRNAGTMARVYEAMVFVIVRTVPAERQPWGVVLRNWNPKRRPDRRWSAARSSPRPIGSAAASMR